MKNSFFNFLAVLYIILASFSQTLFGQMTIDGIDYYGNEWIDYSKEYARIDVEQDAYYRISYNDLVNSGFPIAGKQGSELELYHMGQPVPIRVSTDGQFGTSDYIEFYGERNDGWIDQFLFDEPLYQLNPDYSMYTDNSRYFLTYGENTVNRYADATSSLTNLPDKEAFYMHNEKLVFSEKHSATPAETNRDLYFSSYRPSEGFGSPEQKEFNYTLSGSAKYLGEAPKPSFSIRQGFYFFQHQTIISVNGTPRLTRTSPQLTVDEYGFDLEMSDIVNNIEIDIVGTGINEQVKTSILANIGITYPRQFVATNADQFVFDMPGSNSIRYFEVENFNYTENTVVLDRVNDIYVQVEPFGTGVRFKLPPMASPTELVITNGTSSVNAISSKGFENYASLDGNLLMLTTETLNNGANSPAQQYKTYRESVAGGSHSVMLINSEDIVDQYAYGVKGHAIGMNNFARSDVKANENLEYIYLYGKGLDYKSYRDNPAYHLPTWGYPGSDNLLMAEKGLDSPIATIGRVSVRSVESAFAYLDKVVDYEDLSEYEQTVEDRGWMKKIIHLSGGSTDQEINAIFALLNQFKDIIENSKFGATVNTYRKTTQDNVQTTLSETIKADMDEGAFMITFFGHSSSGQFDFSIEEPSAYNNKGRLPIITSLGCNSGDMFSHSFGLSEKFVTQPEVGSIAFLASSGKAELNAQGLLGNRLYTNAGEEFYEKSIGDNLHNVMEGIDDFDQNINFVTLTQQYNLHGDPALNIMSFDGPDYTPTIENVSTFPEQLSSNIDSFDLNFEIYNLGRWAEQELNYMIIHDYEEQVDTFYGSTITPKFSKMITKRIPVNGSKIIGRNEINIVVDQNSLIEELPNPSAENNNGLAQIYGEGYVTFAYDGSAKPIYPTEYAMLIDPNITLKASADNAFVDFANYTIQIDSTELFNSPLLEETTVFSSGGLVQWTPSIDYQSNTVYYWRIKNDNIAATDDWRGSSFNYYPEKALGWNQSHYYQLLDLDYNKIELGTDRNMDFVRVPVEHKVVNQSRIFDNQVPTYTINSSFADSNYGEDAFAYWDVSSGVYITVIDPETSAPWIYKSDGSGIELDGEIIADTPCGAYTPPHLRDRVVFPFSSNNVNQRSCIMDFIENTIPDGHYVIFYTIQSNIHSYRPAEWESDLTSQGRSLFSILEAQGATEVRSLATNEVPYAIAYQKGVGVLSEVIATTSDDIISLFANIDGISEEATITSTIVGPASEWQTLEWEPVVSEQSDHSSVSIYGLDNNDERTLLVDSIENYTADLSNINPATYPRVELIYNVQDTIDRTAAGLDYWRVYFKPLPEAAINTEAAFEFNNEFLTKGELLTLSYAVENISDFDMDEMLVGYKIVNTNTNDKIEWEVRYNSLPAQSQDIYNIEYATTDLVSGTYELQISVNPDFDQPEQYLFNNVGILRFTMVGNDLNPLLDVTFDGITIDNGDVVSPSPDIQMTLTEDNLFSILEDPELFEVTMQYPDGSILPIDVLGGDIQFFPAVAGGTSNQAVMIYSPILEPGVYKLSVQAEDNSGNLSGSYGYNVEFEVVDDKRIVTLTNYPNPFSNSTNFAFNATGDDLPTDFALIIFNELGEAVRTVTAADIGQLPVGYDRVYFTWDGTDGSGGDLPNGIYFYRLFFGDSSGFVTDKDFSKGYGKIIKMR